jgi:hypothetical protein
MKKLYIVLALLITQISLGQITQKDIEKFKKIPKNYQLDVIKQKKENNVFITTKHKRYEVKLENGIIVTQKIFDTINNIVNANRRIKYQYNTSNNLEKISFYNFDDKLVKEILFQYDANNQLLLKTTFSDEKIPLKKISYSYDVCKSDYISDLINDDEVEKINEIYFCVKETTKNLQSNFITQNITVKKNGIGLVKKIDLKTVPPEETIKRYYTYNYDENNNVISIDLVKGDKIKTFKTNTYNKNNDVIETKSGFSELYYTYKYDDFKNWIECVETSKVASKRTIYKQTFSY